MNTTAISDGPCVFRAGRFAITIERGVPPPPPREVWVWRFSPEGCRYFQPRYLRWALSDERRRLLLATLTDHGTPGSLAFRDLLEFVTTCGPQIVEAMALTTQDVKLTGARPLMRLPDVDGIGRISLPLWQAAIAILQRRVEALRVGIERGELSPDETRLWPRHYTWARDRWAVCRVVIGAADEPFATLGAIRRSAAAHLYRDRRMPLERVARYLRHRHVETTREYLRVTGGLHWSDA